MISYWQQLSQTYNGRAKRERVILLMAALALAYLLWSLILLAPVSTKIDTLQSQKENLHGQLAQLQVQEEAFSEFAMRDPDADKKREVKDLQQRLDALDKELQALAVGLVPAEELPQVLHDVLSNTERLTLLAMHTLPVEKLAITENNADGTGVTAEQQVDVYQHSVELKVRGSYFAVTGYLRELEALHWRFYWDKLDYTVENYPQAIATLRVYTLSAGEGLLGE